MERKKLESLVWKHTHKDFKGVWTSEDGTKTKTVLHYVPAKGTCAVSLSSLTDEELYEKLPSKVKVDLAVEEAEAAKAAREAKA